ncbi:MAG TPA: NADH-quinone oxidoreductase subunit N [Tepidisphaeraceae bacterium]|jgi:NADH-quinone oxidoreductase subunit N
MHPTSLVSLLLPEVILTVVASSLFLLGLSTRAGARKATPVIALVALGLVFAIQLGRIGGGQVGYDTYGGVARDGAKYGTVRVAEFTQYVKLITAGVGMLLVLLAWPTNREATGNGSLNFGADAGEFFALMLLSITGVFLVAGANDIMLLFLGIELASIPTYIMVSLSRPSPVAQEAGVKYFFLGAFAAAIMLLGFSYLYGTTGSTNLYEIMHKLHPRPGGGEAVAGAGAVTLTAWQSLAVLMLVAGFAFKMAVVPLHFYAGDVYQGAATPVTAFLSFVPKTTGFIALIKLLFALGGPNWLLSDPIVRPNGTGLLWVLAVLTMTFGNVLGLLQYNIKRVMAYSSIAHSGYMLVALSAVAASRYTSGGGALASTGVQAVLFYLAAYGIMNVGVFAVLQLLPAKDGRGSAETFEDLAGTGRRHVALGLAMAVCCFSLTGIPLTVGFMGKLMIVKPALAAASAAGADGGASPIHGAMAWLAAITMVNAAISAAYYLRIVATMFLRGDEHIHPHTPHLPAAGTLPPPVIFVHGALPISAAVILSVGGTLMFGAVPGATDLLGSQVVKASRIDGGSSGGGTMVERGAPSREASSAAAGTSKSAVAAGR